MHIFRFAVVGDVEHFFVFEIVYGYVDFVRESTVQGIHILYVTHNYDPVYLHV